MSDESSVAILGISARLPKAPDVNAYWRVIEQGLECVAQFEGAEIDTSARHLPGAPGYVMAAGVLEDIDLFDAGLFRMSPTEAALTDPQHRLFLECAWEAFEDAGYGAPDAFPGAVAVYAGSTLSSYAALMRGHAETAHDELRALVGSAVDYLPALASYRLDLRGESLAVQAACATGLVAVHLGCQSLLTGQSDLVLAGAAAVDARQRLGYEYDPQATLSPDGHCRPFSRDGRGTVRGSGVGAVVLRRLEDALADGDPIRAVIRGTAVTNDGRERVGLTAPSAAGQARAIATALAMAGASPESIGYVEAHGTGTPVGDALEVKALTQAFGTTHTQFCRLGSVKANIGHLSEASGMASLIKAVLMLERATLPGLTNFAGAHPMLNLQESPFVVERESRPWQADGPRRVGVNSYAVGGTNAHLILEEAPAVARVPAAAGPWPFPLSAATPAALEALRSSLAEWLQRDEPASLADLSRTLVVGRRTLAHRWVAVAGSRADLIAALQAPAVPDRTAGDVATISPTVLDRAVEWLRTGSDALRSAAGPGPRIRCVTYPFQRERFWIEPRASARVHGLTWWLDR